MLIYGLKNCDSCKNALRAFKSANKSVEFIDLKKIPVTAEILLGWLKTHGDGVLMNRKSTTWRNLCEVDRQQDAFILLQAYPTLIKRPVIVDEKDSYVGWTADVRTALGIE